MFFTEKKKKKGRRKTTKKKPGNWFTRNVFRPFSLFCLMIIVALVVITPRMKNSLPELASQEQYRFSVEQVEVLSVPDWIPHHFVKEVLSRGEFPESILEEGLAEKLSRQFSAEPWVRRVDSVRLSYPPRAEIELTFREPVACLKIDGKLIPVDREAVLLPQDDLAMSELRRFPVIQLDVQQEMIAASLRPGTPFHDPSLQKACQLAESLQPHLEEFDFEQIRVQRMAQANEQGVQEPIFEILSASGSLIVWGRAPGTLHPGELKPDQKIGRLKVYHERFKGFDKPDGPYEIDITHWTDITRKPLKKTVFKSEQPFH